MSDCVKEVKEIFSQVLLREVEPEDADLLETGILDSMALVELLFSLEQRFGFSPDIATLDLEQFRSIPRIAAALSEHVRVAAAVRG